MKEKEIMDELYEILKKANHTYHNLDNSLMLDSEFDQKLATLAKLEKKYPHFKKKNSPTEQIGGKANFKKVKHTTPMLSIAKAMSQEEVVSFIEKRNAEQNQSLEYVLEHKMDGMALSLIYQGGKFKQAVTRGDGDIGEDVTVNVTKFVKNIPFQLNQNLNIEIRGEVYITRDEFIRINQNSGNKYANARNLAAGTMRQINLKDDINRNLKFLAYNAESEIYIDKTIDYFEKIKKVSKLGFEINHGLEKHTSIDAILKYLDNIDREHLEYEIDGVVIKINSSQVHANLGQTATSWKSMIAYKFPSREVTSPIRKIFFTVGRTGRITPNAEIDPVIIDGSKVQFATLHNEDYINKINLNVNDIAAIIKAGEIIPKVLKVVNKQSSGPFKFISHCPSCNQLLVKIESEHYCQNRDCVDKIINQFIHFASKQGMNIVGLNRGIILKLFKAGYLQNFADIYRLTIDDLLKIENFQETSAQKLLTAIENSKATTADQFLYSLGINNIGKETSKLLTKNISNLQEIKAIKQSEIIDIHSIGNLIIKSLLEYLANPSNLELIDSLISVGVEINIQESKIILQDAFDYDQKVFVITGSFQNLSRDDLTTAIQAKGGLVRTQVNSKTDYLIIGENPGSKYQKAQSLNVIIKKGSEIIQE